MRIAKLAVLAAIVGLGEPALALDKVKFGTNWLAEPEAGGFFQAAADGTYAKYGLDVTIIPGGPQSNGALLLLFGKIEFFMGGDQIGDFLCAESKLPLVAVAAEFQKSPQILMSHPRQGLDKWADLPNAKTAYLGAGAVNTFYAWLRLAYGFKDEAIRPYNFNSAPFIQNKASIQQGYVTDEPYAIEKQGGFKPNVFLLSDYGYSTYSTLIETRREIVEKRPDLVQRFVDASAIGWRNYLYGDPSKGNELIKADNPDITDDEIAFSINELKEHGIVDSGDTLKLGHRRDDRRALEGLLRQDGGDRHGRAEHRLQKGLHSAIRRQGRPRRHAEVSAERGVARVAVGAPEGEARRCSSSSSPAFTPERARKPQSPRRCAMLSSRRAPSPAAWRSTPSARFATRASFISTRAGSTKRPSTFTPNCRTRRRFLSGSRRLSTIRSR